MVREGGGDRRGRSRSREFAQRHAGSSAQRDAEGDSNPRRPDALKGGEDVSSSAVMEIHVKKKEETKYTCGGGAGLKITRRRCRLVSSAHGGREERSN